MIKMIKCLTAIAAVILVSTLMTGNVSAAQEDNGCDEYGRIVSNPAGIDLSREVAAMLGYGIMESGWVSIYLNF